ncbi:amino acid adenylation domain-containing protein [Allofrancisella inopinata]|uniref:Amino acid adenylation domain-containing protein n=1 Tax=Allofrancisella inopinata TaxID=1085647 RepID=A0AAE6YJL9_9GAMM|nr:amino acid adenylation domain-containing protein [Allofrancisella inopinata]QIV96009.1 amino acid adenylation domain-containing protein [Allofrancisella inopinata]TDT67375.1 amino acid adenylation domain-containing protein [Allofrancisella inopinata]
MPELDKSVIEQANNYIQLEVKSTLIELFADSLKATPSFIAVVDCEGQYSYKTISEYSNAINLYLHDNGLCKSGKLIGVLSEKGYKQVVATLGIMQSSSAYLPLNVDWPRGRCDEVLSEGNVDTVLLSNSEFNGCIKGSDIEDKYNWLIIEDIINYKSNTKLEELFKPSLDDIAYVIFTSGSTGKPKGVTISHSGAVNTIQAVNDKFDVNKEDKILALSELSFDLSVYDIFGLLAAGGTIVFPDQKKTKEPSHWYELIDKHNITIWDTVPQLMSLLVDYVRDSSKQLPSLKVTLMSGDWIPLNLPIQIKEVCPNITVMSLGGATEGSIWSIWYEIAQIDEGWKSIPYGQAMPNQKMYILNEQGQHNPLGVIGEIHIGGQGVALNYWQDQEKTQASFIEHPQLGRLYKTGDLGKWDKNGYIVFEGRIDGQVKLNGYRVELDEISSKLAKLPGIENALVTIQDNHLVGYLVSESFKKKDNEIDYQAFKLEQRGILKDLKTTYNLNPIIDIDRYKLRKSYRKFDHKVDISSLDIQIQKKDNHRSISTNLTHEQLTELLSPLRGVQLEDRVLPKYLYPSGGSAYSIRAFVNIPKGYIEGIDEGVYYYHPTEHALQFYKEVNDNKFSIEFNLYIPAMEPLYKEETLRLAYLELGHILQLLNEKYPVAYEIQDKQDGDYHKLVKVTLDQQDIANKLNIKKIDNDGSKFDSYDLNSQSIMLQRSELGNILIGSSGVLIFEADKNQESYIQAGYRAQEITTYLYQQNIGSTALGFNLSDSSIYTIAIGGISQEQKQKSEVNVDQISLENFISKKLMNYLPRYMIPEVYLTIDHLPLTVNGKIDYKSLPMAELVNQDNYVAPTTELEKQLCKIWEEVLKLDKVGITDDFFRIGGNSIFAIKLAHKVSEQLHIKINVADIFRLNSINNLSNELHDRFAWKKETSLLNLYTLKFDEFLPNMLFIHPAFAGAEVYQSLATKLSKSFNCIGIDNYNIYSKNKIDNLNDLAKLYVSEYLKNYSITNPIYLLGWSSGGALALEMAGLLELNGIKNIKTILLDTLISKKNIPINDLEKDIYNIKTTLKKFFTSLGHQPVYSDKIISSCHIDLKISNIKPSAKLRFTDVLLVKAKEIDNRPNIIFRKDQASLALPMNNIDLVSKRITLKKLDCHHGNILEFEEDITDFILQNK